MTITTAAQTTEWQNLFGVCACLGEDFGFNPLYLRIAFGAALIFQPVLVLATYAALGVVVLVSRIAVPSRRRRPVSTVAPRTITAANCDAPNLIAQAA